MTVKFVPLFFKNRVGFSPVATNALYVASPLFMMAGSRACGRLSREALGRPRACAYFMGLAALGLVGLSLLDSSTADGLGAGFPSEPDRGAPGRPLASAKMRAAAVGLYLLTNAQHMCRPLKKSALMDHVPYGDRASGTPSTASRALGGAAPRC
ncbi:major facilitator superfamily-like protein [Aureococcus anophagefferens]|nr:major facilitator superfamily-like protein [Aureococcus anophagefferens]